MGAERASHGSGTHHTCFDLERSLWGHKAGDVVSAQVVRDGKVTQVALTLGEGRVASADTTPQTGSAQAARPVVQR